MTFDFWHQVRQAEALDELRQLRPAAYRGLPFEPGDPRAAVGSRDSDVAL